MFERRLSANLCAGLKPIRFMRTVNVLDHRVVNAQRAGVYRQPCHHDTHSGDSGHAPDPEISQKPTHRLVSMKHAQ
jgi:hypothetical protein